MTDIDIAKSVEMKSIDKIARKAGIEKKYVEQYGKYKCKIDLSIMDKLKDKKDGNVILVTSINPTPFGEGKTTVSVGLTDALNKINKKTIGVLREPSLGPVFGMKGGAAGGGHSQVVPMEDINLHFTGDIHAITAANNLISAMIDNHIYQGNSLKFKTVVWKRCMDLNDRQLRKVETGLSSEKNTKARADGFDITVASEIMAILCLSKDIFDLKNKVSRIVVGYNEDDKEITVKDIKADGAVAALLKDAINPNLVQTLEHNPVLIHGGPFANIAHGCNSIVATKMAMKLGDYVVTEAGFGADLGAEKFVDIKCRKADINLKAAVCVATIKALKYHGGMRIDDIKNEDLEALKKGSENLLKHILNLKECFGLEVVVAINKFSSDTKKEINLLKEILEKDGVQLSLVECWEKGGNGAIDLAKKVCKMLKKCNNANENNNTKFAYPLDMNIDEKVKCVAKKIYGAEDVNFSDEAIEKINKINNSEYRNFPICIAKTQYSFSDNPKNLMCEDPFNITVKDIELKAGAGFIVVYAGSIITMPGLPKIPAAESIDIDENGNITGLF